MRDMIVETARDSWWLVVVLPVRLAWRYLWRMVVFAARPDLYERLNQVYEWEKARNRDLESENDRLRARAASSDSPPSKGGASTSLETTDP